jgi:hypothetical protein
LSRQTEIIKNKQNNGLADLQDFRASVEERLSGLRTDLDANTRKKFDIKSKGKEGSANGNSPGLTAV